MANTVENYYGASWVNVSDYVDEIGNVPYVMKNRDWTLRLDTLNIALAATLGDARSAGYNFDVEDKFVIKNGSTYLFSGDVESSVFDYSEQVYNIRLKNSLYKLQETFVGYNQMHDAFATGTANVQYWTDYLGYKSVQVLWALEKAFTVNGLALDVPAALKATTLFTRSAGTYWDGKAITYADLYFDEYQLYCLGIASAALYSNARTSSLTSGRSSTRGWGDRGGGRVEVITKSDYSPEVNCFDFVSEILTTLGLGIKPIGSDSYQLIIPTGNYTVADDDKFDYEQKAIEKDVYDIGFSFTSLNIGNVALPITHASKGRAEYYTTETKLSETPFGGDNRIAIMTNFTILYADTNDYSGLYNEASFGFQLSSDLILDDNTSDATLNVLAKRYQSKAMDFAVETITTNIDTTFNAAVENQVDVKWNNSEIVQETY